MFERKKKEFDYFEAMTQTAGAACRAAEILKQTLMNLNSLPDKITDIHKVENDADTVYHQIREALGRAFITPIEREDIMLLAQGIDDVVDTVEDVVQHLYMFNITSIRPEAVEMVDLICKSCHALETSVAELRNFAKSKKIHDDLVAINEVEEQADRLYLSAIRNLFCNETNQLEIMKWREIFEVMEQCCDACEHTADKIESVILKNT